MCKNLLVKKKIVRKDSQIKNEPCWSLLFGTLPPVSYQQDKSKQSKINSQIF